MSSKKPLPFRKVLNPVTKITTSIYAPPGSCQLGDDCVDCHSQFHGETRQSHMFMSYAGALSNAAAAEIALTYTVSIKDDLRFLRDKITSRGDTILRRWNKKTRDKRATTLKKAFPRIYPVPWIALDPRGNRQTGRKFREAHLLPYINLEMFSKDPMKLLSLLASRTRYDPDQWVAFDERQTRSAWNLGIFETEFASCCVVLYGLNYGQVVPWNMEQAHRWDIAGFPRGRLILEAQALLMRFLRSTVEDVLDGADGEGSSVKWNQLVESGFPQKGRAVVRSAFTNQAFSPPIFSIERLHKITCDRIAESEDHLWLLQTDPLYFQFHVKNITQGRMSEDMGSNWHQYAAQDFYQECVWRVISWRWVLEEIRNVQAQYQKFYDNIFLGQRLPPKVEFSLACLELMLINLIHGHRTNLLNLLPKLLAFRGCYTVKHSETVSRPGNMAFIVSFTGNMAKMYSEDPLHWCVRKFTEDPEFQDGIESATLFSFLENWLEDDATTKADKTRMDPALFDSVSDLAVLHELLAAVRQHRPVCTPTTEIEAKATGRSAWRCTVKLETRPRHLESDRQTLGEIFKEFESNPFPKGKRDKDWIQRAEKVRHISKRYWAHASKMQQRYLRQIKETIEEDYKESLALISFDSAPEHLAALKAERDSILAPKPTIPLNKKPDETLDITFSTEQESILPPHPKAKIKTRPETTASAQGETRPSVVLQEPIPRALVEVKRPESACILTSMYPTTVEDYNQKPLDWIRFVGAMQDAGFSVAQSGGSAVTFIKAGEGRIVFHKPHPVPKIHPVMLQSMGKRLHKWFKWSRNSFECVLEEVA